MMDYHGFWQGFVALFGILPVCLGAAAGVVWAWRKGRRGRHLIAPSVLGGAALSLLVFMAAVLFFGA